MRKSRSMQNVSWSSQTVRQMALFTHVYGPCYVDMRRAPPAALQMHINNVNYITIIKSCK